MLYAYSRIVNFYSEHRYVLENYLFYPLDIKSALAPCLPLREPLALYLQSAALTQSGLAPTLNRNWILTQSGAI